MLCDGLSRFIAAGALFKGREPKPVVLYLTHFTVQPTMTGEKRHNHSYLLLHFSKPDHFFVRECLLRQQPANRALTPLCFHPAGDGPLLQPPLWPMAAGFLLSFLSPNVPGRFLKSNRPPSPAVLPACSLPAHRAWPAGDLLPLGPTSLPHAGATNQPSCPVTSTRLCCCPSISPLGV